MNRSIYIVLALLLASVSVKAASDMEPNLHDTLHLANDSSFAGFEKLDSLSLNYDVYISGENHTYLTSNSKLWVKMFKYLHANAGVRNIIIEYGFSSGYLINKYIQTGDTDVLAILDKYAFHQHVAAYKELREYYESVDSTDRFNLIGIDLERGTRTASKVLDYLLPETGEPHDSIALHIESLKSLVSYHDLEVYSDDNDDDYFYYDTYSVTSTLRRIMDNFKRNELHYQDFLGENFETFRRIVLGLYDLKKWNEYENESSTHQFVFRERYMFNRFKEEYQSRDGKFYGQFGRCHTAKNTQEETSCDWFHFRSIANRIEQWEYNGDSLRVFTMGILYQKDDYSDDGWDEIQDRMDSLFAKLDPNRIVIYDLPADSLLNANMAEMFDLLIFNTYQPDDNYPYIDLDDLIDLTSTDKMKIFFTGGTMDFDLTSLNSFFGNNESNDPFTSPVSYWAVETGHGGNKSTGVYSGSAAGGFIKQSYDQSENVTYRLRGWTLYEYAGYNVLKSSKVLDLIGTIGAGYNMLKLDILEKGAEASPLKGFLGETKRSTYTNPALFLDFGGILHINIKAITLGIGGGYMVDLSNPAWRTDTIVPGSMETSLTGIRAQGSLGFNFDL